MVSRVTTPGQLAATRSSRDTPRPLEVEEEIRTLTAMTLLLPLSHPPGRGLLAGHHGRQLQVVPRQHQPTRPDQSQVSIGYILDQSEASIAAS